MARALAAAIVASLLAVSGAAGTSGQKPRRGGTVVVAGQMAPACLTLGPCNAGWLLRETLEGAFEIGPDLTYRANLVTRVAVKEKPFTLTYYIRRDARWSDGVPVTASDFVFTYQTFLKKPELSPPDAFDTIRDVRPVDAKTFRVVFKRRLAGWRELFHLVLPKHALAGEDLSSIWRDRIDNPKTGEPIGSGPFLVERLDPGRELTLIRNPRYWGPHTAYLARLVVRTVEGDAVEAIENGQVDVALLTGLEDFETLRRQSKIRLDWSPGTGWEHFDFRLRGNGHPALRNRLVRRAIAYGIDREAWIRDYRRFDPAQRVSDSAIFPTQSPYYEPNWKAYRYRPAEARRLLERAGCSRGADGIYSCGDRRLRLRMFTTSGSPPRALLLRAAQAQLRKIGVEGDPLFVDTATLFRGGGVLDTGDFDLALFAWNRGAGPPRPDYLRCVAATNFTGYCNRQVSRDLLRSDLVVDARERAALLSRIDAKVAADVPVLPLYQTSFPFAFRAAVHNVVPNDPPEWIIWNSENWWLER